MNMAKRTITVTFDLEVPEGVEEPDGSDIALFLQAEMNAYKGADRDIYHLNNPTVYMEPLGVIVDFSGGIFHGAFTEVPTTVVAIDTDDEENRRAATFPWKRARACRSGSGSRKAPWTRNTLPWPWKA
jgi:hypothetical protein